jgi:hypothetical protein
MDARFMTESQADRGRDSIGTSLAKAFTQGRTKNHRLFGFETGADVGSDQLVSGAIRVVVPAEKHAAHSVREDRARQRQAGHASSERQG